ncbi:hypothetical protein BKA67DRAFT_678480 [Truncatella angustata]|uniref:Uncharacterized protein n=1 Tax=Truncatella angustata TaxID=152316 RepID=A0A9P8UJH2_9PEZI|nr:uncharacterized protein BKA67DRAFT_678480 [Truncatella angustata]KAH6653272.1 hypothetical protein BKA67DRAFT_678480 [Truncatella angustata]KAH8197778.1 hypothetical protein TruAng_008067 [Truncatella angustata]
MDPGLNVDHNVARWEAPKHPKSAINETLRMYYIKANASTVEEHPKIFNPANGTYEVDHFLAISFVSQLIYQHYDYLNAPWGEFALLSQHLNHPCNLYRLNKDFNQSIGRFTVDQFANSAHQDADIREYLDSQVRRPKTANDGHRLVRADGTVTAGTVRDNVSMLLTGMQNATGPYAKLTKFVGARFEAYLRLQVNPAPQNKPSVADTNSVGGFVERQ